MSARRLKLTLHFPGDGAAQTIMAAQGSLLMEALAESGVALRHPCGGAGTCGKCVVRFLEGAPDPNTHDREHHTDEQLSEGVRLSCHARLEQDAVIEIPLSSLQGKGHKVLAEGTEAGISSPADDPLVAVVPFDVAGPTLEDNMPDARRICEAIGRSIRFSPASLQRLADHLKQHGYSGRAVLYEDRLLDVLPADSDDRVLGAAVDIGTTTIAVQLVDLIDGRVVAVAAALNPQTAVGDDVISRIDYASSESENLERMQWMVIEEIDRLIGEAIDSSAEYLDRHSIYAIAPAGNTTMLHLACGLDPAPLASIPFVSLLGGELTFSASELGLTVADEAIVVTLPIIAGFVGGDTVAGLLAVDMPLPEETSEASRLPDDYINGQNGAPRLPSLLVDIGTNGEIVLATENKLIAASTAAGPTFEGARIHHGMRAGTGAIERIELDSSGDLEIAIIGSALPIGICGSALIDVVALLLDAGVITSDGRLLDRDSLPDTVASPLADRVMQIDGRVAFRLVDDAKSDIDGPIVLTEKDVRELQLASGAIRAGIELLLARANMRREDLGSILIAGGFGNYIRPAAARRIGLIPPEVDPSRVVYCGNTAIVGARHVLGSRHKIRLAGQLADRTIHIELADEAGFSDALAEAMFFPEA